MLEKWTIIYIEFRYRRLKSVNGLSLLVKVDG